MANKVETRIRHKHDTELNWEKALNFIPLSAELIVYDTDASYSFPRLKVGDGVTPVNELPFVGSNVFEIIKELGFEGSEQEFYEQLAQIKDFAPADLDYIIEQNTGAEQRFWAGTREEFLAIEEKNEDTLYMVTGDETGVVSGASIDIIEAQVAYTAMMTNTLL